MILWVNIYFIFLIPLPLFTTSFPLIISQGSLKEFSNLYNNLHFPNFKDVAPCMVIPLKNCFTDLSADIHGNEDTLKMKILGQPSNDYLLSSGGAVQAENELSKNRIDSSHCVELPTCTVCLRRLQCVASGVEGGNDIPVSMWFSGNIARCRVCGVYGEGAENDGAVGSSKSSRVRSPVHPSCAVNHV
jgi:hypothetical protein